MKKIGIDFHGVIDTYPEEFAVLSDCWIKKGYEVHIITGQDWERIQKKLANLKISFSKGFSIVDYNLSIGTEMQNKESGWWMENNLWNKCKGEYCLREKIDIHFDNDLKYAEWFPDFCTFVLVREKGFENFFDILKTL